MVTPTANEPDTGAERPGFELEPEGRYRRRQLIACAICFALVVANELCQRFVVRGWIEDRWIFGYGSDLFAVPFCTTLACAIRRPTFPGWILPVAYAVLFSLLELEGYRDVLDMICYWSGALIAYAIVRTKR